MTILNNQSTVDLYQEACSDAGIQFDASITGLEDAKTNPRYGEAARVFATRFERNRKSVLTMAMWDFSMTEAVRLRNPVGTYDQNTGDTAGVDPYPFLYSWDLPQDFIGGKFKLTRGNVSYGRTEDQATGQPLMEWRPIVGMIMTYRSFMRRGNHIFTNVPIVDIDYTRNVEDLATWEPGVLDILSNKMALQIALRLNTDMVPELKRIEAAFASPFYTEQYERMHQAVDLGNETRSSLWRL